MNAEKKNNLEKTYERIIHVGLCVVPYEDLSDLMAPEMMLFGTTKDEKIFSFSELDAMFKSQYEQMAGLVTSLDRKRLFTRLSNDGNNASIIEEATLTISSRENVNTIFMRCSCVMEYIDNQWKLTHWHASTPVETENDHWHMEEWKREKEKLQQLVDEQTADLKRKNRELEIEAAIERVRTRTMAMRNSDELAEVSSLLFQQLVTLGVNTYSSGFTIWDENQDELISWMCNADGSMNPPFRMPLAENRWHNEQYEYWKNGKDLAIKDFNSKEMQSYFRYLRSFPLLDEAFKKSIAAGHPMPERQVHHVANFSHGNLLFITLAPCPKAHELFKRFAKVFEQTYTRFLDLQKAEAQAREAQIEVALEKVRSRSMAMHSSQELKEVALELRKQMGLLGQKDLEVCAIHLYGDDKDSFESWSAMKAPDSETEIVQTQAHFPKRGIRIVDEMMHHYTIGTKDYVLINEGEKIAEWFKVLKKHAPELHASILDSIGKVPVKQLKANWAVADFSGGALVMVTYGEPDELSRNLLRRSANVFEQAYVRFLDLQKAEAQAREAQIETALEKVRSRTMAMQKGDELQEVAVLLYKELIALGVENFVSCGYVEIHESTQKQHVWITSPGGDTMGLFYLPLTGDATFDERYAAWKKQQTVFHQSVASQIRRDHIAYAITTFNSKEAEEMVRSQFPDPTVFYCFNFSHGYLHLVGGSLLEKEEEVLLARFSKVFEQTYTRFLDLQKAEAQVREAKIETALEKVRSRTMGMQSSDELPEVANLLFTEVRALGINAWSCGYNILAEDKKTATCCMSSEGTLQTPFQLRLWGEASFDEMGDFIQSDENMLVQELNGKAIEEHYAYMKSFPDLKPTFDEIDKMGLSLPTYQVNHLCKFNQGFILFITYEKVPDAHDIFKRFTKVFDQTYTRFLDLQKAEARAREAQIQTALERVRSHSMGMQSTSDFANVTTEMFNQLRSFGENLFATGIVFCNKHEGHVEQWHSIPGAGMLSPMIVPIDLDYIHQYRYDQWKAGNPLFSIEIPSDFIEQHFEDIFKLPSAQITLKDLESRNAPMPAPPPWEIDYGASFKYGYILVSSLKPIENMDILPRFAQVFEQAYIRFLDLQKAEAQAKEAKIEAALEKVRSVALSLKNSDDMLDIAKVLYEQLLELGFTEIRNAIIDIHNDANETFLDYDYSHDMSSAVTEFSFYGDPVIEQQIKKVQSSNDAFFEIELKGKDLEELIKTRLKNGEKDDPRLYKTDYLTYNLYSFGNGAIGISNFGILSDSQKKILKRFRNVFTFAYKRYTDLANAEAQAMEAKIEASLEKVRSVALGLNKSDDMLEVAQALYEQLLSLGFTNIRNSIIDIDNGDGLTFSDFDYSHEMGGTVTQMSYNDDPALKEQLEDILATTDGFSELVLEGQKLQDLINMRRNNGEKDDPRLLHSSKVSYILYAFGKGAIGISNFGVLPEHQKSILSRFRNVFTFAYQRYTDLAQSEAQAAALLAEKQRLEVTLADLQATQSQLIQAEKMASLGELTAGIAHEIQNPLNFVNNFSEVSNELIDEIQEERAKNKENRNEDLVDEILGDIKQNLEKINHHGKRADGIVKGMLQHSRAGGDKKEPTDINVLADEYLRLAYHGLRAKDKSFNAELVTNFDESLQKINVVPQDIGRVILNLLTNAFYAVHQKKQTASDDFKPTVSISTKQFQNEVNITVSDNGNGIPDHIKDKIFQPFFTTKPSGQGTGLGLSMSFDIIKAHGGMINVQSNAGEGTTFIINLPREIK